MNTHFHIGLKANIQSCHPASRISTCHPTHSMCWLLWSWFEHTKFTAPNHPSHLSRLPLRRPQWMWVPLKAKRRRTQQGIMPHFFLRMSRNESIGILLPATLLTPIRQDMYLLLQAGPPHHRIHDNKRRSSARGCLFPKKGECRSLPVMIAASPYQPKSHPNAQENLKHYTLLIRTLTIIIIGIFNSCAYIRIRIYYVSLTNHKYILVRIYTEPNWSGLGLNRYETNWFS